MVFLETISEREKKKATHKSANFQIVTCNLLTFSYLHPVAARGTPVRQQQQSRVSSCKKPRCDFFFNDMSFLTLKNSDENHYVKMQC